MYEYFYSYIYIYKYLYFMFRKYQIYEIGWLLVEIRETRLVFLM